MDPLLTAAAEGARKLFVERHGLEVRRQSGTLDLGPESLLREAGDLGFVGVAVSEEQGGSGGSVTLAGVIAEEAGAALVHGSFLHQSVAAFALARAGRSPADVAAVVLGRRPVLVCWDGGMRDSSGAFAVPFATQGADLVVLHDDGSTDVVGPDEYELTVGDGGWLLPVSAEGCATVASGRRSPARADGDDARACRAYADAVTAMYMLGAARRLLDDTVVYVANRRQFGVPVGSFQAVKHRLADAAIGLIHARATVVAALEALDADGETTSAALAKSLAGDAARAAAEGCLQASGGYGFTWEADVHLFLKVILRLRHWPLPAAAVRATLRAEAGMRV